jgi:hypothetical protein
VIAWLTGARWEFGDQALVGRPRTPDTLKERGRPVLIGTKESEVASWKGSGFEMELKDVVVDMSIDEC